MSKLSKTHLDVWRLFITAHSRLINKIDTDLQAAGQIPLNWYDVLIELDEAPDKRLRMAELADKVVLSRSGLTRLVDKLEKADLLTREIDPDDRRGFYAIITEKGQTALHHAWEIYRDSIVTQFASFFSLEEARMMQEIFTKMIEYQKTNKK